MQSEHSNAPVDHTQPVYQSLDVPDLENPSDSIEQGGELGFTNQLIFSSQAVADSALGFDHSWLAVAKSGVRCVLCTVRGFRLRCMMRSTARSGVLAQENKVKEGPCVDETAACKQCGLQSNWHKLETGVCGTAGDGLRDDELISIARLVALWKQITVSGALIGNFDAEQIAAACTWLERGAQGECPA
jgi:hypothetical protein